MIPLTFEMARTKITAAAEKAAKTVREDEEKRRREEEEANAENEKPDDEKEKSDDESYKSENDGDKSDTNSTASDPAATGSGRKSHWSKLRDQDAKDMADMFVDLGFSRAAAVFMMSRSSSVRQVRNLITMPTSAARTENLATWRP